MDPTQEHARNICESKFRSAVVDVSDFSRTNKTYKVEFTDRDPVIVKYNQPDRNSKDEFLGSGYLQNLVSDFAPVPEVHQLFADGSPVICRIQEYVDGEVPDTFETRDYPEESCQNIAHELGRQLGQVHNVSLDIDNEGIVRFDGGEFSYSESSWREELSDLIESRYSISVDSESGLENENIQDMYSYVRNNIELIPETVPEDDRALNVLDYRPGNIVFNSDPASSSSQAIIDIDKVAYGDWMLGLAIGEFYLTNTCVDEELKEELHESYREGYFEETGRGPSEIDEERYQLYKIVPCMLMAASFNAWFKDENEQWMESQQNNVFRFINELES